MAHVRVQGDRIGLKALEGLARVLLGGRADVAALGVENHRDAGMPLVNVGDQRLQFILGAVRREVRDLRLEGAHQIRGGIDDRAAEGEDRVGACAHCSRQPCGIGVEPHAQQRIGATPRGAEHRGKGHRRSGCLRR